MAEMHSPYVRKNDLPYNHFKTFDPMYEARRNALIPEAVKYADYICGEKPEDLKRQEKWSAEWNRVYHLKMNYLAVQHNIFA